MVTPASSGNILAFYWFGGGVHSGQRHNLISFSPHSDSYPLGIWNFYFPGSIRLACEADHTLHLSSRVTT